MRSAKKIIYFVLICIEFSCSTIVFSQWTIQNSNTTSSLIDVHFYNSNYGYAVGMSGVILKTSNGGLDWSLMPKIGSNKFMSVFTINGETIYVSDNSLYKSLNGGESWENLGFGNIEYSILDIFFINENIGFIVKGDTLYKTTDAGKQWKSSLVNKYLSQIQFTSNNTGYVSGGITMDSYSPGLLFKTTDCGINWKRLNVSTDCEIVSHSFVDDNIGYVLNYNQELFKTKNGGKSWAKVRKNRIDEKFTSCVFVNPNEGYLTGGIDGEIYKSSNGGVNWYEEYTESDMILSTMYFPSSDTGYAVGSYGTILKRNSNLYIVKDNQSKEISEFVEQNRILDYHLSQNFPNPFNPETDIQFFMNHSGFVSLEVYNYLGKKISTLVNEFKEEGLHSIKFNGSGLASGIYFYKLSIKNSIIVKSMVLIK